jgi:predicted secreted protein
VGSKTVQGHENQTQAIHVVVGETFAIRLAGNPTTGYTWQAKVDACYLEPVDQTFEPQYEAVGAGGWEILHFRALRTGETEICCEYRRPWGGGPRDTGRFQVKIA